jgi:phytol kinase
MSATAGILAALQADLTGAIIIAVSITALFVVGEVIHRVSSVKVEYTRKLTHVGAGVIVMSFPWLIHHVTTVAVLAVAFLGVLVGGKVTGLLGSVHNVERRTSGAYYYPGAVLGAFWLSGGDPLLYCAPLAIMAVADTGAALVGQEYGETRFKVLDGERSFEGSATFFGLAFGVMLLGLTLAQRPGWPEMLLVALVVSILATAVEAVSVRGSDNLLIPYMAWLVMERTLRLGLDDLSGWILGMLLALGVVVATFQRARLTGAGALLTFVMATLTYALGGVPWLLPLALLYALFVLVRPPEGGDAPTDLNDVFPSTAGSVVMVILFAHTEDPGLFWPYLVTVSAHASVALALLARRRSRLLALPAALAGAYIPAASPLLLGAEVPVSVIGLGGVLGLLMFLVLARTPLVGRRVVASLASGLIAWLLFDAL